MKTGERPVLGVLTGDANLYAPYIRSLIATAREAGITAYSFSPRMWRDGEAPRAALDLPLPTVVYNRLPTRREEVSASALSVKRALRQQAIPYFNERFVNKKEIDKILRSCDETAAFLPETVYSATEDAARELLERHGAVFVKPISGSFGEGICRIGREGSRYLLAMRRSNGALTRVYENLADTLDVCRVQMGGMACLLQEEIPLLRYDGCKTDFRVHVQRIDGTTWRTVAIGAKIAHPTGITTHVHSGGRVEAGDAVLAGWFGKKWTDARERLEAAARATCRRVSEALDPQLGELGLDMGLANDGRIVVFEANAKPGRAIFHHRALHGAGVQSRKMILRYAQYLHQNERTADGPAAVMFDGS